MAEQPRSPFSRLDTSLLRSTRDLPATVDEAPAVVEDPVPPPTRSSSSRKRPVRQSSREDSRDASELASTLASHPDEMVAAIRKVVRTSGREVSYVRLTAEEKAVLGDIVYTFKKQGKKTTENEINRIAVNFLLEDYRVNGANSILVKVIDSLLA